MVALPGVGQDHAAAEDPDRDTVLLTQLLQEHFARPLGAAVPACSRAESASDTPLPGELSQHSADCQRPGTGSLMTHARDAALAAMGRPELLLRAPQE